MTNPNTEVLMAVMCSMYLIPRTLLYVTGVYFINGIVSAIELGVQKKKKSPARLTTYALSPHIYAALHKRG